MCDFTVSVKGKSDRADLDEQAYSGSLFVLSLTLTGNLLLADACAIRAPCW